MGIVIFAFILVILAIIAVIYLVFVKPLRKKAEFNSIEDAIYIGMSEDELLEECGDPSKTVEISKNCKLLSYYLDEWKGVLFGGTKRREITVTIKNGKVTSISQ